MGLTLIFEFSRSYVILTIWWPRSGVRIYQIVTGVTSVVGVPSTHLVQHKITPLFLPMFDIKYKKNPPFFNKHFPNSTKKPAWRCRYHTAARCRVKYYTKQFSKVGRSGMWYRPSFYIFFAKFPEGIWNSLLFVEETFSLSFPDCRKLVFFFKLVFVVKSCTISTHGHRTFSFKCTSVATMQWHFE